MVRESKATHIDFLLKIYAERHGLKGIKLDPKYSDLDDGVIHFTHEVSLPKEELQQVREDGYQ